MKTFILLLAFLVNFAKPGVGYPWRKYRNPISNVTLQKAKPIQMAENWTEVEITATGDTLFVDSLSELTSVVNLSLYAPISTIEPGAVCSSPNLKSIEIIRDGPRESLNLTKETFKNCNNLEEINLLLGEREDAPPLPSNVFQKLPNLKSLHVGERVIKHLSRNYFRPLKSLTVLHLHMCFVKTIDADAFQDLSELEEVEINYNEKLTHIPQNLFANTKKLKSLMLYANNITGLTWDEFDGLNSLKELLIGRNRISNYDAKKIAKFLPNLKYFNFQMNPLDCKKREAFANELKSKLNNSISIDHKFDPGFFDSCEDFS